MLVGMDGEEYHCKRQEIFLDRDWDVRLLTLKLLTILLTISKRYDIYRFNLDIRILSFKVQQHIQSS